MATKNVIHKIKISEVTATPSSLAPGEQAYSFDSNSLFIGDPLNTPIKIGGAADVTKLAGIEAGAQVNTVNSVAGKTGNVTVTASDVGLGNVTNESKATMFNNATFTGTTSGITKGMVGLGNVDNTSDADKPVSTATQTALNLKANLTGATFSGNVYLATSNPSLSTEAASKGYVDSVATGLSIKEAVRTASALPLTLASDFEEGDTVGGVVLVAGDRVLIKAQTDGTENGIYVVQSTGAPVRAVDFDNIPNVEVRSGTMVFVSEGTYAGTQWVVNNTGDIIIGTTAITFVQFGGGQTYTAGTGLGLDGNEFYVNSNVVFTTSSVSFDGSQLTNLNANAISSGTVESSYLPSTLIYDGDTLDGGTF